MYYKIYADPLLTTITIQHSTNRAPMNPYAHLNALNLTAFILATINPQRGNAIS